MKATLNEKEAELYRDIYEATTKTINRFGSTPPMAFITVGNNCQLPGSPKPGSIVGVELEIPENGKDAVAAFLKHFCKKADAQCALLVLESWMSCPTPEQAAEYKRTGEFPRPSQDPNRKEIVMFSLQRKGQAFCGFVPIQRTSLGIASIPEVAPELDFDNSEGRFSGLLDD